MEMKQSSSLLQPIRILCKTILYYSQPCSYSEILLRRSRSIRSCVISSLSIIILYILLSFPGNVLWCPVLCSELI